MALRKQITALAALLVGTASFADTITGSFHVNISMTSRPGLCLSESLSAATNASVQVVCQSGQFVSIDPSPGRAFLGVHGGAFRYFLLPSGSTLLGGGISPFMGKGTVTELRLYNVGSPDEPLEVLISF